MLPIDTLGGYIRADLKPSLINSFILDILT